MHLYDGNGQSPNPQFSEYYQKCTVKVIRSSISQCPAIKNHTSIFHKNKIIIFGGYDSKRNHNDIHIYSEGVWTKAKASGRIPEGRNGHTATVVDNKMYVIGGWLGQGTYAAKDVYVLDLDALVWSQVTTFNEVPGPCNMHSADLIGHCIYVFRGGDGKDYLNDLHQLNTKTHYWSLVQANNDYPPPRANHSSAVIYNKLYIFGGWDGTKRLNDLYSFDVATNKWTELKPLSPPSARAGMCMVGVENKIYLFGGSGPQVTCYGDLQCYDPIKNNWQILELQDDDNSVKARSGHSMTGVGSQIYIFGGSCGSVYYKDFFIIETDSPPDIQQIEQDNTTINNYFKQFFNNPRFSDITFQVEGQLLYAHKLILSKYEMFAKAFEWNEKEMEVIVIRDCSLKAFNTLLYYIYSGEYNPELAYWPIDFTEQLLQVSDQYLIYDMKVQCEKLLQSKIEKHTINHIKNIAEQCNAQQLKKYCDWYQCHFKI